jgi:hypothetical protein
MLNTLGEVITCAIALIAVLVVPAAIIRAWFPVIRAHIADMLMSRSQDARAQQADIEAVSIPVSDTSINDGIDWQMPRVSAYLTDNEFLIFLARQKRRDGKYRLSANDVYKAVGGNRNDVLDIVRQVRAAPDFSQRTAEQEQERSGLAAR